MARTRKTRPHDRKILDHPVEMHDHRNGICELQDNPQRLWQAGDHKSGACYLAGQYWRREFGCGHTCYCNYGWWEQEKSRSRRARKAAARDWDKDY